MRLKIIYTESMHGCLRTFPLNESFSSIVVAADSAIFIYSLIFSNNLKKQEMPNQSCLGETLYTYIFA